MQWIRSDALKNIGLLLLAFATIALAYLAVTSTGSSSGDPAGLPRPASTPTPATPTPSPTPAAPRRVVLLGDVHTAESGPNAGRTFVDQLATEQGWTLTNLSAPGSGYVAATRAATFDQLAAVVAASPDVVVLSAGADDASEAEAADAVAALVEDLRAELPSARIVLLAPVTGDSDTESLTATLRETAAALRVHFVDLPETEPELTSEGQLTPQAHAALATALEADFDRLAI